MKEARHHHYIPQCYLRGFSVGSGKRRRLTVANLESSRFFETSPRNVGGIRDFNRVDLPGVKPDALEGMLAKFESDVALAIRAVELSRKFEGQDRSTILNLAALLAVRSPRMRDNLRRFEERVLKQMLGMILATRERWESQKQQMKDDGHNVDGWPPYEEMRRFHREDEYTVNLDREHHIGVEFSSFDSVLKALNARKWQLFIAASGAGCFVTSDRPVVLTWNEPEKVPAWRRSNPGFGLPNTEVLFPLTQNMVLLGAFDGESGVKEVDKVLVAMANSQMISFAFSQVYAPRQVFPYVGPGPAYHHDGRFFENMASLHRKQPESE